MYKRLPYWGSGSQRSVTVDVIIMIWFRSQVMKVHFTWLVKKVIRFSVLFGTTLLLKESDP